MSFRPDSTLTRSEQAAEGKELYCGKEEMPMKERGNVLHPLDGQKGELVTTVVQGVYQFFRLISKRQLAWLLLHRKEVVGAISQALLKLLEAAWQSEYEEPIKEWGRFYFEVMEETVDFSDLTIPTKPHGDWWLIVVIPDISYGKLINALGKLFSVSVSDDFCPPDSTKEQRRAFFKPYAIWVRAQIGGDVVGKSANDLANTKQITLVERLLLEGVYFKRTGKHLDVHTGTLCVGSRDFDGKVPEVDWYGKLRIGPGVNPEDNSGLRSRSVSC